MNIAEATEQRLLNKIRNLPLDKIVEVEDFVDFLALRSANRPLASTDLEAMASDPDIQAEIAAINREFSIAARG
jgi:hypothetical protein